MTTDYRYGLEIHKNCGGFWLEKHIDWKGVHYRCTGCGKTKVTK